jgi:hypothetical protein
MVGRKITLPVHIVFHHKMESVILRKEALFNALQYVFLKGRKNITSRIGKREFCLGSVQARSGK